MLRVWGLGFGVRGIRVYFQFWGLRVIEIGFRV
jgi:hypothetical protein